jgi:rubrerythrin
MLWNRIEGVYNMSLKNKKIKAFIKDEKAGSKEYGAAAMKACTKTDKQTFRRMAKDEKRHRKYLEEMLK